MSNPGARAITAFASAFAAAIDAGDDKQTAGLMSLPCLLPVSHTFAKHRRHVPSHPAYNTEAQKQELLAALSSGSQKDRAKLEATVASQLPDSVDVKKWAEALALHLLALSALYSAKEPTDYERAYSIQHTCLEKVLAIFEDEDTNWLVPTLHVVVHDTVYLMRELEVKLAADTTKDSVGEQLVRGA